MSAANQRLRTTNATSLLREFTLTLALQASTQAPSDNASLVLDQLTRPNAQVSALRSNPSPTVTISATYIAAPSLQPVGPPVGGLTVSGTG